MKKYVLGLLVLGGLVLGCSKNDDNGYTGPTDLDTQNFMWQAMNLWYFWQADVPNLADDRFESDLEYTEFLGSETDPAVFFDTKLRYIQDRFSFYSDDYVEWN